MTIRALPLKAHGAVGDGRGTAALVAADASIDWFCPVRFDAPAALFRILDDRGAHVRLGPTAPGPIGEQAYEPAGAPILTTTLTDRESLVSVVDHMEGGRIVRVLTVLRGSTEIVLDVEPGDRFGPPRKVERWSEGVAFGALMIRGLPAGLPVRLAAGDRRVVTITRRDDDRITRSGPERSALTIGGAFREHDDIRRRWRSESGEIDFDGVHRSAVLASARALRMLTDPTTGALVRALTTSLPARLDNERNIDERYAWLRDNAAAVGIWERLGRRDLAGATREWLAGRAGDDLPLAPVYRVDGDGLPSEEELSLPGWRGSGPVRVGNRASAALDLGAIAELSLVLDADRSWGDLKRIAGWLSENGMHADHGRWDSRSKPVRTIESAVAVRAALAAIVRTTVKRNPLDLAAIEWRAAVQKLDVWLLEEGLFGQGPTSGWRRCGGDDADDTSDASMLRWLADVAPSLAGDDEFEARDRSAMSIDQSVAQLTEWPYLHRHLPHVDDGFPPGQGADLWASFTMVSALCSIERWEEAHARMETLLGSLGPTQLGATHADPMTGDLRGNLLAAPVHLAIIEAAFALTRGPR